MPSAGGRVAVISMESGDIQGLRHMETGRSIKADKTLADARAEELEAERAALAAMQELAALVAVVLLGRAATVAWVWRAVAALVALAARVALQQQAQVQVVAVDIILAQAVMVRTAWFF